MISQITNKLFFLVKRLRNLIWNRNHKKRLTVWFVVRCYHTNMVPMVQAFLDHNDSVKVLVNTAERNENHNDIKPTLIDDYIKQLQKINPPDLLIIRELSPNALSLLKFCKQNKVRTIHYTQKPSRRPPGFLQFKRDLRRIRAKQLAGLPLSTITPLDSGNHEPPRLLHKTFMFPVNPIGDCNKPPGIINVLQVGKLAQPLKRHNWTIEILRELNIPIILTICGTGLDLEADDGTRSKDYYESLMLTDREVDLNKKLKISIQKDLSQKDLWQYYRKADIFVLPSEHEEFGISVLESMSANCAAVVSQESGASRHIHHGDNGLVFDGKSKEAYRKELTRLIEDHTLRKKIQVNASQTITSNHSKNQFRKFILNEA